MPGSEPVMPGRERVPKVPEHFLVELALEYYIGGGVVTHRSGLRFKLLTK